MSEQDSKDSDKGNDERTVHIYTLEDPRTGEPRYIGATMNPKSRFANIKSSPHSKALRRWIGELEEEGREPRMTIQKETNQEKADKIENRLIDEYRKEYALLNDRNSQPYPEYDDAPKKTYTTGVRVTPEIANRLNERRKPTEKYNDVIERLLDDTKWMRERT